MHCSNLASDALRKAIDDYRTKGNKQDKTAKIVKSNKKEVLSHGK